MDSQTDYELKRDILARQYKQIISAGQQVRLKKTVSNLFRDRPTTSARLDVRSFSKVIGIDEAALVAVVEGMATYRTIVEATLRYGLLPAVVPELATITAGGAVSGGGIEASSFRFGLVHETILSMEVLLPTGELVTATAVNQYSDLFYGMANSFGTLGYILKLTIRLVRSKSHVKIEHYRFSDMKPLLAAVDEVARTGRYHDNHVDFMDGVGFEASELYLSLGSFVDKTTTYVSNYRYMKQYFRSIQTKRIDYLTTHDFIWRWDTDWFWCSKNFYMDRFVPRIVLGKWLLRSEAYWRMLRLNQKMRIDEKLRKVTGRVALQEDVIQDVQIPLEAASDFWQFFLKDMPIRPVWFCPTKSSTADSYPLYQLVKNQTYINFGFWDHVPARSQQEPHYYNKLVEAAVDKFGGKKGLYSKAFYSRDKFWEIYNGAVYSKLKTKYDPESRQKDLFQKSVERE